MKLKPKALWTDKELASLLDAHFPKVKLNGNTFSDKFTDACHRELFIPSPVYRASVVFEKLSPPSDLLVYTPKKDIFSPTERFCMDLEEGEARIIADPRMPKGRCFMLVEKSALPMVSSGMYFVIPESVGIHVTPLFALIDQSKFVTKTEEVSWE